MRGNERDVMRRILASAPRVALTALSMLVSCTGSIEGLDSETTLGGPPGTGPQVGPSGAAGAGPQVGPSGTGGAGPQANDSPGQLPLRRLTRDEYSNTIRDLFGDVMNAGAEFPEDATGPSGFATPNSLSDVEARHLLDASETVGLRISSRIPGLVSCDPSVIGDESCARQFVTSFGRRAYRRPLLPDEIEHLVSFFKVARNTLQYSFYDSARTVVQAMLQSPNFLYHHESAAKPVLENGLVKFDSHEMASRLSYFLWNSMPDAALFAATDADRLQSVTDIEQEARRMLRDPKVRDTLRAFHFQWLGIDDLGSVQKDAILFPKFGPPLVRAMQQETLEFVADVILNDGRLGTLLTAPYSFINSELAPIYGITGAPASALRVDNFARVPFDPARRSGLLTQASFLTMGATNVQPLPPRRGKRILERFLCRSVPDPPNDVPPPPPVMPNLSNRERFEAHGKDGCASACHGMIDPLGFAFENYDAVGAYRTQDGGKVVNASGSLPLTAGQPPVPFNDAIDMSRIFADNDEVRRCIASQWFGFALGRHSVQGDAATFERAYAPFAASGADLRELLVEITKGRSFLYRAPAQGEVLR